MKKKKKKEEEEEVELEGEKEEVEEVVKIKKNGRVEWKGMKIEMWKKTHKKEFNWQKKKKKKNKKIDRQKENERRDVG